MSAHIQCRQVWQCVGVEWVGLMKSCSCMQEQAAVSGMPALKFQYFPQQLATSTNASASTGAAPVESTRFGSMRRWPRHQTIAVAAGSAAFLVLTFFIAICVARQRMQLLRVTYKVRHSIYAGIQ
jgi:hypothetical protein